MSDTVDNNAQRIAMAKRAAMVMQTTMAGVPNDVQVEAALILTKALFLAMIKPEHCLGVFNSAVIKLRTEIKDHLKGKANAKAGK